MSKVQNTRKNVIALLNAKRDSLYRIARYNKKEGNEEWYSKHMREVCIMQEAIWLLEDKEYFNKIWNIYMGGEA